jgi:hypothetical protein
MGSKDERTDTSVPELGSAPDGPRRTWVRVVVAGFLLVQLLVPLRYYLGDDQYDERFSWRMFSATRVVRCRTIAHEAVGDPGTPRPVQLMATIHEAWIETLRRNREDVIRAFLARRCDEEDVREVVLVNQCVDAAEAPLPLIEWRRECETGEVREPGDPEGT